MRNVIELLVFCVDGRRFGVPLECVRRVVRAVEPTPLPQAPPSVLGIIDFRGTIVPVLDIRGRFGGGGREIGLSDQFVIADTSRRIVALLVDETRGLVHVPQADVVGLRSVVSGTEQFDGVIRLPDGLLLIQDLEKFLSSDEEAALQAALSKEPCHGN